MSAAVMQPHMALRAQRFAVRHLEPKVWVVAEVLDVMRVRASRVLLFAAFATRVVVARLHRLCPVLQFDRVSTSPYRIVWASFRRFLGLCSWNSEFPSSHGFSVLLWHGQAADRVGVSLPCSLEDGSSLRRQRLAFSEVALQPRSRLSFHHASVLVVVGIKRRFLAATALAIHALNFSPLPRCREFVIADGLFIRSLVEIAQ